MSVLSVSDLDYSAEELKLAAWCAELEQQAKADAAAVDLFADTEPTPEAAVETTNVERFIPWDIRLAGWLFMQMGLGTHDGRSDSANRPLWAWRRAVLWCCRNWPRFRMMLWVLRSGKAADDVTSERWEVCDDCEFLKLNRKAVAYCGSCGCVDWRKSRLLVKNRCELNHCPRRKHPGSYIEMVAARYPNRKKPEARKGGCGARRNG